LAGPGPQALALVLADWARATETSLAAIARHAATAIAANALAYPSLAVTPAEVAPIPVLIGSLHARA